MSKNNKKITWKAVVALVLVMATLFAMASFVNAEFIEQIFDKVEELGITMSSSKSPYMTHYEVTETWPNGNIKTITYWTVNRTSGDRYGTQTYTSNYPESGDGVMGPYGTPGGFHGCYCPNCVGLYN